MGNVEKFDAIVEQMDADALLNEAIWYMRFLREQTEFAFEADVAECAILFAWQAREKYAKLGQSHLQDIQQ